MDAVSKGASVALERSGPIDLVTSIGTAGRTRLHSIYGISSKVSTTSSSIGGFHLTSTKGLFVVRDAK